jgi:hypothetical protein
LPYKGHDFYGTWFDRIDPKVINWIHQRPEIVSGLCSALFGPVDEFQTVLGVGAGMRITGDRPLVKGSIVVDSDRACDRALYFDGRPARR